MTHADNDDPAVWLLLWDRGRRTGDFDLARRAKRELERLGVRVSCHRPNPGTRGRREHEPHE
jgi:hypothetical protein